MHLRARSRFSASPSSYSRRSENNIRFDDSGCARQSFPMPRKSSPRALTIPKNETVAPYHAALPPADRRLSFGEKWSYAPAPETAPVKIDARYELFIDGKFAAPNSGKY